VTRPRQPKTTPDIVVSRRSRVPGVRSEIVRREARRILFALGESDAELTVSLVADREIHELNREYRHKDRPTDVLAFAMREGATVPETRNLLGDVVISLETAEIQAKRRRHSIADEVRILLVHGILHLLGYDHERSRAEARRMFKMQRALLRSSPLEAGSPKFR
jgi:rRNA maturation RNase YbeY